LANQSGMQVTAITYFFDPVAWTASFNDKDGTSYVDLRDAPIRVLLDEIKDHFSERDEDEIE
jgi:hypothetical protein